VLLVERELRALAAAAELAGVVLLVERELRALAAAAELAGVVLLVERELRAIAAAPSSPASCSWSSASSARSRARC
jgi:hypothetical protein